MRVVQPNADLNTVRKQAGFYRNSCSLHILEAQMTLIIPSCTFDIDYNDIRPLIFWNVVFQ